MSKQYKVNLHGSIITNADPFEIAEINLENGKPKSKRMRQEEDQSSEYPEDVLVSILEEDSVILAMILRKKRAILDQILIS